MKITVENIQKGIKYFKHYGFKEFLIRLKEKSEPEEVVYSEWFEKHRISEAVLKEQRAQVRRMKDKPLVSILVPTYKTPEAFLRQMVESVQKQSYDNWELCIADATPLGDGNQSNGKDTQMDLILSNQTTSVRLVLEEFKDVRIKYQHLEENAGIAQNTNCALDMATGDYIGLLDHDDLLEPDALYEVVQAVIDGADMVYTDEDKVLEDLSEYYAPHFKPDFSVDLLRSNNYITHFTVAKKTLVDEIVLEAGSAFRAEFDGAQDYDFILRCSEKAEEIVHIPKVLYHWRMHEGSTAANQESKTYAFDAGARAVQAHLDRVGVKGKVETTENLGFYRVKYALKGTPLVSIIIPNKDNTDSLDLCLKSIAKSTYQNYEVIIVENNSTEEITFQYYEGLKHRDDVPQNLQVVTWESGGVFNYSAINNYGAGFAKGEYLLLLNNDIEILTSDWLEEMLSTCQREEVGIVGARLFYPDDTIQHAGIVVGIGGHARGIASNMFVGLRKVKDGYLHKSAIQLNYSAVTAACLMVKRAAFDAVNGLTETLAVAFNDVDFCLKVREKGYLVCYNPYVVAYHYESKSRGEEDSPEKQKRFHGEIDYMREHWNVILRKGDPYYNINLSRVKDDYSLGQ